MEPKKASDLLYGKRKSGPGPKPYEKPEKEIWEDLNDFLQYSSDYEDLLDKKNVDGFLVTSDWEGEDLCWVAFEYQGEELQFNYAKRLISPRRGPWLFDFEFISGPMEGSEGTEMTFEQLSWDSAGSQLIELLHKRFPFEQLGAV